MVLLNLFVFVHAAMYKRGDGRRHEKIREKNLRKKKKTLERTRQEANTHTH